MRRLGLACGLAACLAVCFPGPTVAAAAQAPAPAPVIAVVVHPAAATGAVDADALAQIFKRRKIYWRDGVRIQPVNLPADHPLRQRFSQAVLRQTPEALDEYWNEQYFHGVLPPHVQASETAVLRFVAATAGAIGYLDLCTLDDSVRVLLTIDGDGRVHAADAEARSYCQAADLPGH
ncbi:MAG: hypothetical protein WC809_18430 [Sinimarinibacterium sp.]|jgi:ABC-type phosphate transport system substrate-binding protein